MIEERISFSKDLQNLNKTFQLSKILVIGGAGTLLADEVDKQGIGFKIKSEELSDIELFLKELNYNTLSKKICALNKISNLSSSNIKTEFHNYLTKIN